LEESSEKLIVFGIHKIVVQTIYQKFKSISVKIDGSTPNKKRQIAVDKFQNNQATRLMIGNITAAGVGHNMTAASSVLLIELPWTPAEVMQCIDRAHRIGQTQKVNAYILVGRKTIEEKLWEIIDSKWSVLA